MQSKQEQEQQQQTQELQTQVAQNGPRVEKSDKKTKQYSKRVIIFFLLCIALLLALITMQAQFKIGGSSSNDATKNYRTPQSSGFAELATSMRRDRRPVQVIQAAPETPQSETQARTQRIVIDGTREPLPAQSQLPTLPRYYSNRDNAQAASILRTMKIQALTARPIVDDFKLEENGLTNTASAGTQGAVAMRDGSGTSGVPQVIDSATMAAIAQQSGGQSDQNRQTQKQDFLRGANGGSSMTRQGYSQNLPVPQQFPYELKAGTIIPGILITGINSDLPGNVLGQVSENVWDTSTGKFVLIPKGSKIIGVYDSEVSFGQNRVLLVWNRLIFPNGTTLNIAGSPGVDIAGYSGLSGRVNKHWGKMFGAALLSSVFVTGAEIVYDKDSQGSNDNKSPRDVAAESVAGSILDMGTKIMNKATDIQPTIKIRPGKKFGIFVQEDVVFPFPYL
ncbi:conjugal transfer protein TrbI [Synergistales bacterium]|nr:conjugal transfer protein TrbI [Synergistales bacterium]